MQIEKILVNRIKRKQRLSIVAGLLFLGIIISLSFTIKYGSTIEDSIKKGTSTLSKKVGSINAIKQEDIGKLIVVSIEASELNALGSIALSKIQIFAVFQAIILGFIIAKFISMLFQEDEKILLSVIQRLKKLESST